MSFIISKFLGYIVLDNMHIMFIEVERTLQISLFSTYVYDIMMIYI